MKTTTTSETWEKAPARGMQNPKAELFRYPVIRNADRAERFTDRKPAEGIIASADFTVWDNKENQEVR